MHQLKQPWRYWIKTPVKIGFDVVYQVEQVVYNQLMSKNPMINAFGASAYILLVASILNLISRTHGDKPDTFFAPVAFLSLFTLSVAIMAYLFFYQSIQLFIDGKKKEAVNFFLKTVGTFGAITIIIWALIFSGLI